MNENERRIQLMQNRSVKNTDENSQDRIWLINKEIGHFWFNHNDREDYNSYESTVTEMKKLYKKAQKDGYENIYVKPTARYNEFGTADSEFISLYGDRLETESEYKNRLQLIKIREKNRRDEYEALKRIYEPQKADK